MTGEVLRGQSNCMTLYNCSTCKLCRLKNILIIFTARKIYEFILFSIAIISVWFEDIFISGRYKMIWITVAAFIPQMYKKQCSKSVNSNTQMDTRKVLFHIYKLICSISEILFSILCSCFFRSVFILLIISFRWNSFCSLFCRIISITALSATFA